MSSEPDGQNFWAGVLLFLRETAWGLTLLAALSFCIICYLSFPSAGEEGG